MEIINQERNPSTGSPPRDFKALYRKLDRGLGRIEQSDDVSQMLINILESLVKDFPDELGFESGRLYQRDGDYFYLRSTVGPSKHNAIGYRVPPDYPAHRRTLEEGLLILRPDDPDFDADIEQAIGVVSTFAAIAVGPGNTHVLAFSVKGEIKEENILYSLSAVRHVINLKLEQQKLAGMLEESRIIQESLLPKELPRFAGYEFAGRSHSCEVVGGDLYDYLPFSDELLGLAIGDASGHGLPAALMARDVITGLRMGIDEHFKVVRVVERLNRVIHRATLSSRFISLFYGELEPDGLLFYSNAGHNPPLVRHGDTFTELSEGGLVLGPNPNARYARGYIRLRPGDTLFLYTDGLIERENHAGEQFGMRRLRQLLLENAAGTPAEVLDRAFDAVEGHAQGTAQTDDITVVVVSKT